jgi:hypothetical protein
MQIKEPTQIEYHLSAKVKFVDIDVKDHNRNYKRKLVILIPEVSTEQMNFFKAWLPEVSDEYFELATIIHSVVATPCRMAILKSKQNISDKPYLMIMSKGVEEDFINYKLEGKTLRLTILAEGNEEALDEIKDSSGNFDTIHGQESL